MSKPVVPSLPSRKTKRSDMSHISGVDQQANSRQLPPHLASIDLDALLAPPPPSKTTVPPTASQAHAQENIIVDEVMVVDAVFPATTSPNALSTAPSPNALSTAPVAFTDPASAPVPRKKPRFEARFSAGCMTSRPRCSFCTGTSNRHSSYDCPIFVHPKSKSIVADLKQLCKRCLRPSTHPSCPRATLSCSVCSGDHHFKFCTSDLD